MSKPKTAPIIKTANCASGTRNHASFLKFKKKVIKIMLNIMLTAATILCKAFLISLRENEGKL